MRLRVVSIALNNSEKVAHDPCQPCPPFDGKGSLARVTATEQPVRMDVESLRLTQVEMESVLCKLFPSLSQAIPEIFKKRLTMLRGGKKITSFWQGDFECFEQLASAFGNFQPLATA